MSGSVAQDLNSDLKIDDQQTTSSSDQAAILITKGSTKFGFSIDESLKILNISDRNRCENLTEGDVLVKINDMSVHGKSGSEVLEILNGIPPDSKTNFVIQRNLITKSTSTRKEKFDPKSTKNNDRIDAVIGFILLIGSLVGMYFALVGLKQCIWPDLQLSDANKELFIANSKLRLLNQKYEKMELEKGEEIKNLKLNLQVSEENHGKLKETLHLTKERMCNRFLKKYKKMKLQKEKEIEQSNAHLQSALLKNNKTKETLRICANAQVRMYKEIEEFKNKKLKIQNYEEIFENFKDNEIKKTSCEEIMN